MTEIESLRAAAAINWQADAAKAWDRVSALEREVVNAFTGHQVLGCSLLSLIVGLVIGAILF